MKFLASFVFFQLQVSSLFFIIVLASKYHPQNIISFSRPIFPENLLKDYPCRLDYLQLLFLGAAKKLKQFKYK